MYDVRPCSPKTRSIERVTAPQPGGNDGSGRFGWSNGLLDFLRGRGHLGLWLLAGVVVSVVSGRLRGCPGLGWLESTGMGMVVWYGMSYMEISSDLNCESHRIHTYIYHKKYKNQPNVGKYTIHGWYGNRYFFARYW